MQYIQGRKGYERFAAAVVLLALFSDCACRRHPALDAYCPKDPAFGQLNFKSVDSENSACVPHMSDGVGQAVLECWRQLTIEVTGCQVVMRSDTSRYVGPGHLPCRYFNMAGNLTDDGVEAQMWADVDGPGLLYYYDADPESVAALKFDSAAKLLRDIWAFLRDFTADSRFDDVSWIDSADSSRNHGGRSDHKASADPASHQDGLNSGSDADRGRSDRRRQLASGGGGSSSSLGAQGVVRGGLGRSAGRRDRHSPMRVYRPSAGRVAVKVPNGCKYRYTVNPDSRVFESPSRQRMHVQWRTIVLTIASVSVVLALVGLGVCTYFSHKHAQYVSSYWEYQAVKDQLVSELPPATYQRLFGEPPKTAAEVTAITAAATAAAAAASSGARGGGAAAAATAGAATPAAAVAGMSPAIQQHKSSALLAEAGEAPVVGAGEPDGISSRSSSADSATIAAAADAVPAVAAVAPSGADDAPPTLVPSQHGK